VEERPRDPQYFLSDDSYLDQCATRLQQWLNGKKNVLCLTGAGLSTESGIPDYRGFGGSYHKGHKPIVHDQFMNSSSTRQRYWARAMIGWRDFANASPNDGHKALAQLEQMNKIGVTFEDSSDYYDSTNEEATLQWAYSTGSQRMSIITQNVDGLHRKAGTNDAYLTELHGRNDILRCMNCGSFHSRHEYQDLLDVLNSEYLQSLSSNERIGGEGEEGDKEMQRPDGDANIERDSYDDIVVPSCPSCRVNNNYNNNNDDANVMASGILKPNVVFFGDSVPKHRVNRCMAAVRAADGLLCVGSSLAVHSAFRFVREAANQQIPIAILNVGETRAETSGLEVLKIEAPAGITLKKLVEKVSQ